MPEHKLLHLLQPALPQMTGILNKATSRSLVLIDEFGKGTLTSDGVGLLAATLESFAAQPNPPQILACTHFSELLQPSVLAPSPQIEFHTMAVMLPSDADKTPGRGSSQGGAAAAAAGARGGAGEVPRGQQLLKQHVFLYKLVPGHAAASFGVRGVGEQEDGMWVIAIYAFLRRVGRRA